MNLADWQIKEFETFGFLVLRSLFSPPELERINDEYEHGRARMVAAGLQPVGVRGQLNWSNLRPDAPFLNSLPEDERLAGVAEQLLGQDAFMVHCNSNQYLGSATEWHPDARFPEFRALKFALYLQPLEADTGALRLIPGSHLPSFSAQLDSLQLYGVNIGEDHSYLRRANKTVRDVPSYVCATAPGDMIAFDLRLWHASSGGRARRLITSDFHASPKSESERTAELKFRDAHRDSMKIFKSPQPQYTAHWLDNPERSARRSRWIAALEELGYLRPLDTGLRYDVSAG